MPAASNDLRAALVSHEATFETDSIEAADVRRMIELLDTDSEPWSRSRPVHFTASAIVVHPPSGRVLLRWHERLGFWAHIGGHADPGETDAWAICLREAREETGLRDLGFVEAPGRLMERALVQVAVVPVPAGHGEPEHEHADLRFLLFTNRPDEVRPEAESAPLRWVGFDEAMVVIGADNLRVGVHRARGVLGA